MNGTPSIAENLARIRERIERAASRAGRPAQQITLVAVSKTHPAERIRDAYRAGVRHFGENRVQEWESKCASLSDLDATWHLIGHLQSNKAARAARLFHSIDSVDAFALAERLERAKKEFTTEDTQGTGPLSRNQLWVSGAKAQFKRLPLGRAEARPSERSRNFAHGTTNSKTSGTEKEKAEGKSRVAASNLRLRVLIEVKLDPGPAKSGVGEEQVPRLMETVLPLPHLELCGLMGVPPYLEDAEKVRPYFRRLRELRDNLRTQFGAGPLPVLSMGMSHDFEVAIEEGATEIRVGTALFGARQKD